MAKLDQIDKKLKCSNEDREVIKKEIRFNKNEYLDNCFSLARATEEKLQQISDKVEATDKDREKNIKKDMQEMKQRYDKCVVAKKEEERDTADKIFEILLNRFGST